MKKTKSNDLDLVRLLREGEKLSLEGIRLTDVDCRLGQIRKGSLPQHAAHSIFLAVEKDSDDKRAIAVVQMRLTMAYEEPTDVEPAVEVSAKYKLNYSFKTAVSAKLIDKVVNNVALMNIWPYWRELVQSMTTRMGLPPFPLPLMRPGSLDGGEKKTDNQS